MMMQSGLAVLFALFIASVCAIAPSKIEPADTIITPNTTTPKPTPPPTTPKPPPVVLPPFVVTDNVTHVTCLLANLTATVKVSWNNTLNNTYAHREFVYNVTTAVEDAARSKCNFYRNLSTLALTHMHESSSSLVLDFSNTSKTQFGLTDTLLQLYLDPVHYDGMDLRVQGVQVLKAENLTLWQTGVGSYYECMVGSDTVKFQLPNKNITDSVLKIELRFDAVKVQALMTRADNNMFGKASVCYTDRVTSEIVPIVVGCALAALVIIVLAAYLIGRRRSRARGYESM